MLCSRGHRMRRGVGGAQALTCDACGVGMGAEETHYSCALCDFDLCLSCASKQREEGRGVEREGEEEDMSERDGVVVKRESRLLGAEGLGMGDAKGEDSDFAERNTSMRAGPRLSALLCGSEAFGLPASAMITPPAGLVQAVRESAGEGGAGGQPFSHRAAANGGGGEREGQLCASRDVARERVEEGSRIASQEAVPGGYGASSLPSNKGEDEKVKIEPEANCGASEQGQQEGCSSKWAAENSEGWQTYEIEDPAPGDASVGLTESHLGGESWKATRAARSRAAMSSVLGGATPELALRLVHEIHIQLCRARTGRIDWAAVARRLPQHGSDPMPLTPRQVRERMGTPEISSDVVCDCIHTGCVAWRHTQRLLFAFSFTPVVLCLHSSCLCAIALKWHSRLL